MDTPYKLRLCSKIDSIASLERSGYGATYGKERAAKKTAARRETIQAWATVLILIACVLLASYGDTLSGVNPAAI